MRYRNTNYGIVEVYLLQLVHFKPNKATFELYFSIDMTMSLYLFLDMYLHSGEYHVGTVGIDIRIRNYIYAVLMR